MGFEDLASELHKHAEAEGKKLMHASERAAGKTEDEARAASEEAFRAARKEAASFVKQESSERLTSAKLSAKKILDEARDEAVGGSLLQVWRQFKSDSLRKTAYPALLQRLLKEALAELGSGDATVYVRDENRQLVSGYKLSRLPSEYTGGVIVESTNGKVRVNKTLEEAFAQKKGSLRKQIYDKLF